MQRKLELVTPPVRQALSFEFESLLPVMIDSGDMESSTVMVRHNGNTDPRIIHIVRIATYPLKASNLGISKNQFWLIFHCL